MRPLRSTFILGGGRIPWSFAKASLVNFQLLKFCIGWMERVFAVILLVTLFPSLILIGFVLRANTDGPVLVTDQLLRTDGTKLRLHRFRTTGRGTQAFRAIGRFLRSFGIDDIPAMWNVARGQIGFRTLAQLNRTS